MLRVLAVRGNYQIIAAKRERHQGQLLTQFDCLSVARAPHVTD